MHWVWNHSQSKGTARHCLLALADKAQGADCMAPMGTAEFMQRSNSARSAVVKGIDLLLKSGELTKAEEARGSRPTVYAMPLAVGYVRPKTGARDPESGPLATSEGSGIRTPKDMEGSGIRTPQESASSPESGPGGSGIRTPWGPESGPLYQTSSTRSGRAIDTDAPGHPATDGIPDFARPLVDSCTLAGIGVRWPLSSNEWLQLHAAVKKSGVPALAAYALRIWERERGGIESARYFLRGWAQLAPLPSADAERPALRAVEPPQYTDPKLASRQAGRALLDQLSEQLREQQRAAGEQA